MSRCNYKVGILTGLLRTAQTPPKRQMTLYASTSHDVLHFCCRSSCHFHHPDAAGKSEQLRQSLHLPPVQRALSQEAGDPVAARRSGFSARGWDAGQRHIHELQKRPRVQMSSKLCKLSHCANMTCGIKTWPDI